MERTKRIIGLGVFGLAALAFAVLVYLKSGAEPPQQSISASDSLATPQPLPPLAEDTIADLADIKARGKLKAITTFSSTAYYIYKGQPKGFEYELLQDLCKHLDVKLEIVLAQSVDEVFELLARGDGDLIAFGLNVTEKRKKLLAFTEPLLETGQVLIQRKPKGWQGMSQQVLEQQLIRDPAQLIGQHVHVHAESAFSERLDELMEQVGGEFKVVPVPSDLSTEAVIRQVSEGEYAYSVADQHIAEINQTYFRNIDVKTLLNSPQPLAWGIRHTSPKLLEAVNQWLADTKESGRYRKVYHRYFEDKKRYYRRMHSPSFTGISQSLTPFDSLMKRYAGRAGWDWRLLASLIYEESRFNPEIESWAGAQGLMQLMPITGERFGAKNLNDPEDNLKAGTLYINYLNNFWRSLPDTTQRVRFVLASYAIGPGHVQDAQKIAEHLGLDPTRWEGNVARALELKTNRKYYQLPGVKYGYCRGYQATYYVRTIIERYKHYLRAFGLPIPPELITPDSLLLPKADSLDVE